MKPQQPITEIEAAKEWWKDYPENGKKHLKWKHFWLEVNESDNNILHIYRKEVIEPWKESVKDSWTQIKMVHSHVMQEDTPEEVFFLYKSVVLQPDNLTADVCETCDGEGRFEDNTPCRICQPKITPTIADDFGCCGIHPKELCKGENCAFSSPPQADMSEDCDNQFCDNGLVDMPFGEKAICSRCDGAGVRPEDQKPSPQPDMSVPAMSGRCGYQ